MRPELVVGIKWKSYWRRPRSRSGGRAERRLRLWDGAALAEALDRAVPPLGPRQHVELVERSADNLLPAMPGALKQPGIHLDLALVGQAQDHDVGLVLPLGRRP